MRTRWLTVAALLLASGPMGAEPRGQPDPDMAVLLIGAGVPHCIEVDALLRKTCARVGSAPPEEVRRWCALPAESFQMRTARAYAAFSEQHRAELVRLAEDIASVIARTHEGLERQASKMAREISVRDIDDLHQTMDNGLCKSIERSLAAEQAK